MRALNKLPVVVIALGLLACNLFVARTSLGSGGPQPPTELRCEYLSNPMGIDVREPRFAWVLRHTQRDEKQSAYEVLVATSAAMLGRNRGNQWDSGKTASENSTQVVYAGKPLADGQTYYWKVRYWDMQGNAGPYSQPAHFEMGLLSRSDWTGQWIGGNNVLRKGFTLPGQVVRARAYITALGYYELHVNGHRIGHNVLDPAWTVYSKRVLYVTYDVTRALQNGQNAVGVMLGGGWATERAGDIPPSYRVPAFLLQMNVELEGGKHLSIVSDTSWKITSGPIVSNSVYNGEIYDARLEQTGWDTPGFNDAGWAPAERQEGTSGELSAEMMPPIRVMDTLVPQTMTNPEPGVYVYDMGQNFAGWAQLRVRGPRGAQVKLRFSELIYPDGKINRQNLHAAKARDIYILRGEGLETYEPRFTYHGFRYVELTGYPGTPSLDTIRGRVVGTAVETTGSFAASKQILNQIQRLIHWGQLSNLYSIPTDCDQRNERQGWMGDAQVTAEEAMMNFDMAAFYINFVRDIHDSQRPDGSVPDTVPHKYGRYPADPAWGTAYPLLCWYMWQQYGDRRILAQNYDGLKKYVEFLRSRAQDDVLSYSYYGDWVAVEPTPGALVSDAYYYYDVEILASIAKILGNSQDAATYLQLASGIKQAFNHKFFNAAAGQYANSTQTAQALPLFLSLVPPDDEKHVVSQLTNDIVYGHNTHLTTGFIGVKYLLPVLTRFGRSDLAYELATQTTYPSWGYMIAHGATTLWELWQDKRGPSMNSQNHAMMGSLGAWFYKALGGINLGPDGEGYRRVVIAPQVVEDLRSASASIESVFGQVSCSWQHSPGAITMDISIPVGADAQIVVPKEDDMTEISVQESGRSVWANGHFVSGDAGISAASDGPRGITFDAGSGDYHFMLTGR